MTDAAQRIKTTYYRFGGLRVPITNLTRSFREGGRIRIGDKGDKGNPRKLDAFRLTSPSRTLIDAAAEAYGGEVRAWEGSPTEGQWELYTKADVLPVYIPPGQGQIDQWFEFWTAAGCQRRCTGEWETLADRPCLCDDSKDPDARECKITTRVKVMLSDLPDVVVWRLETRGYYAAVELAGTMAILSEATRHGVLLPAMLRLEQRQAKRMVDGKPTTLKFPVPVLEMPTVTGHQLAERSAGTRALPEPIGDGAGAEFDQRTEPVGMDGDRIADLVAAFEAAATFSDVNDTMKVLPKDLTDAERARIQKATDAARERLSPKVPQR